MRPSTRFWVPLRACILAGLVLAAVLGPPARAAEVPVVAAAANLSFALPEIAAAFERATAQRVKLSFGSSGNLARQIVQGGPYELFLSADEERAQFVHKQGRAEDSGRVYAIGRLALFAPIGSPVQVDPQLAGLAKALHSGALQRVAIANPELAPYGAAAREVLVRKGMWAALQGKLAIGENVGQAAQFALTGAVQAAFIPYSIVRAPTFQGKGSAVLVPEGLHAPIRQSMVLLKGAGDTARAFQAFMTSSEARTILVHFGFSVPGQ
jgi:molybdate transport system substrate-binding protein